MLASSPVVPLARETFGRYELLLELGRGGMAVLYLARARGAGGFSKLFAVKQILPHLAADPPFVDMFLNEGRIAARLSHPNLCPVFELGQERGELFLVMEYLDGVPWDALAAAMPRDARGLQLTAGVFAQACEGLHYAHTFCDIDGTAMPIVHRDVSPQNVFVSTDGVCRVLDFGVSKIATDHKRTRTGVLKGKVPYMAPEQLRGEPVDGRADVWAAGVMLWEALAGQRLFDRDTDFLIYEAITGAEIPSVNADGARYPAAIDRVIARALERDRERRYATAREFAHDLLQVAAEIGGAASREQIASALGQLCGEQLAARKRAVATAVTKGSLPQPVVPLAAIPGAQDAVTEAARDGTNPAGDAAATLSMAMRKDAIVVARPRRRRRVAGVVALAALAALAAGVAVVSAIGGGSDRERALSAPAPSARSGERVTTGSSAPVSDVHAPAAATTVVVEARGSSAPVPTMPAPAGGSAVPTEARGSSAPVPKAHAPADPATARAGSAGSRPQPRGHGAHDSNAGGERAHTAGPAAASSGSSGSSGWYAIDSNPYATIFIDERKIGDTPLDRISLAAGAHRVRAVLADGRQRTFAIDIAPDRKTSSGTLAW